ncbi:MAG TPA: hypothetical protein VGB83_12835 [Actinomycetota bacterium]
MSAGTPILATLLVALIGLSSCASPSGSPEAPPDWGPLAVARDDASGVSQARGGQGPLTIAEECVTLTTESGAALTLVWRSGQTSWDETRQVIVFESPSSERIVLADGDVVTVGGEDGARDPDWIAEPHTSCPTTTFFVHEVTQAS